MCFRKCFLVYRSNAYRYIVFYRSKLTLPLTDLSKYILAFSSFSVNAIVVETFIVVIKKTKMAVIARLAPISGPNPHCLYKNKNKYRGPRKA